MNISARLYTRRIITVHAHLTSSLNNSISPFRKRPLGVNIYRRVIVTVRATSEKRNAILTIRKTRLRCPRAKSRTGPARFPRTISRERNSPARSVVRTANARSKNGRARTVHRVNDKTVAFELSSREYARFLHTHTHTHARRVCYRITRILAN